MSERWMPKNLEIYWSVIDTTPMQFAWQGNPLEIARWEAGNVFKTHDQALIASINIKSLLLSLHEPVADCDQLPKLTAEVFCRPDCPEWAQYAAVDRDGIACFYDKKPKCDNMQMWLRGEKGEHFMAIRSNKCDASDWKNSLIERPSKLPDWCKVGEWVYQSNEEYDKIESIDGFGINLASGAIINKKYIHEEAVSARLRPFNADEMKALVGKVIETCDKDSLLVTAYSVNNNTIIFDSIHHTASELIDFPYTIDGEPCGVLEHLENGEWVE